MAEKKLMVVIGAKATEFNKAMAQVQRDTKQISKAFKDVGRDMQTMGRGLTASVTLPILAVGGAAVKVFADFEQAMTASTAIMGNLSEDMRKSMETAAREVAKTTRFSATEAAESYYYLASAGMDAATAIEALPKVAAFAQAGNFDMARATDLLTDAQSALGLTVENTAQNMRNMSRVSDVLTQAQVLANATTEQFASALTSKAGAALRTVNKDVEEGAAILARFADQGIKGEAAGTLLTNTIFGLSDRARASAKDFERLGIKVFDSSGAMRNIADITADMEKAFEGLSTEQVLAELSNMGFTKQAREGILALMGGSGALREYEANLRSAGGVTQDVADKQLNNLWDQLGLIKDRLIDSGLVLGEVLGDTIRETVLPMVDKFVESLAKLAEWFSNLSPFWQQFIIKGLALAAALGPVILIAGKIVSAIGVLIPIITKIIAVVKIVGTVIAAVAAGPILLIIAAIALLVAAFLVVRSKWDEIVQAYKNAYNWLKNTFLKWWEGFKDFWLNLWENIKTGLLAAWEFIRGLFLRFHPLGLVIRHWEAIRGFFSGLWEFVKQVFSNALSAIGNFVTDRFNAVVGFLTGVKDRIVDVFNRVKDGILGVWQGIVDGIRGFINRIISAINGMIGGLNKIKFTAPSWVPLVGGKTWGVSIPLIPKLATGGNILQAGAAIVGERGPELLHLPKGAKVEPLSGGAREMKHSGTIRVEGVNDKGQLSAVVDIVIEQLLQEVRA